MTKRMLKRYYDKYKRMFLSEDYATIYSVYKEPSYRKTNAWENLLCKCRSMYDVSRPIVLAHNQFMFSAGYVQCVVYDKCKNHLYFVLETAYQTYQLLLDDSELSFVKWCCGKLWQKV